MALRSLQRLALALKSTHRESSQRTFANLAKEHDGTTAVKQYDDETVVANTLRMRLRQIRQRTRRKGSKR